MKHSRDSKFLEINILFNKQIKRKNCKFTSVTKICYSPYSAHFSVYNILHKMA